ncbi:MULTISPECIES: hypothetical protein [Streptomyces]|uniref:hypothetical protein n=1 Tax=Streptomyces TaxID=1883 RepID=UPI00117C57AA|nr:hypothetical protein [Streptomyces kasugaensis]
MGAGPPAVVCAVVPRHRLPGTVHREGEGRRRPEFRPPEESFGALRAEPVPSARLNRTLVQAAGAGILQTTERPLRVRVLSGSQGHVPVVVV